MGQDAKSKPAPAGAKHLLISFRVSPLCGYLIGTSPRLMPWATDLLPLRGCDAFENFQLDQSFTLQ